MFTPAASAALALLVVLAGCASAPTERSMTVNGTLKLPAGLERVGIAVVRDPHGFSAEAPTSIEEAVASTFSGLAVSPDPTMVATVPVLIAGSAIAVVGKSAMGAVFGVSPGSSETSTHAIAAATHGEGLADRLTQAIVTRLEARHPGKIHLLPAAAPIPEPTGVARSAMRRASATRPAPTDVTVRVRILFQGLQTRLTALHDDMIKVAQSANPPLALVLAAQILATRTDDGEFLGGVSVTYESVSRRYAVWAENEARLLRAELAAAEQELIREAVDRVPE